MGRWGLGEGGHDPIFWLWQLEDLKNELEKRQAKNAAQPAAEVCPTQGQEEKTQQPVSESTRFPAPQGRVLPSTVIGWGWLSSGRSEEPQRMRRQRFVAWEGGEDPKKGTKLASAGWGGGSYGELSISRNFSNLHPALVAPGKGRAEPQVGPRWGWTSRIHHHVPAGLCFNRAPGR